MSPQRGTPSYPSLSGASAFLTCAKAIEGKSVTIANIVKSRFISLTVSASFSIQSYKVITFMLYLQIVGLAQQKKTARRQSFQSRICDGYSPTTISSRAKYFGDIIPYSLVGPPTILNSTRTTLPNSARLHTLQRWSTSP